MHRNSGTEYERGVLDALAMFKAAGIAGNFSALRGALSGARGAFTGSAQAAKAFGDSTNALHHAGEALNHFRQAGGVDAARRLTPVALGAAAIGGGAAVSAHRGQQPQQPGVAMPPMVMGQLQNAVTRRMAGFP